MKKKNLLFVPVFYLANFITILLYLFPGSLLGCFLYNDCSIQPRITRDFIVSSNHFYMFFMLTSLGILAFHKTKNIRFLVIYLLLLSIILELSHIIVPVRGFEWPDIFGNILGVILVIIIYKFKYKNA